MPIIRVDEWVCEINTRPEVNPCVDVDEIPEIEKGLEARMALRGKK